MHGTHYEVLAGRLVRVVDRSGICHAQLVWDVSGTDRLVRLTVEGATVEGAVTAHPLLGAVHRVGDTAMTVVDWARPTEIPAIAEPGRLPLGAGAAILNTLALLAQRAGVTALRYAGPYPTAALWRSLARSFSCSAEEAAFTAGALDRAVRVARDPIAIDFAPAPHERVAIPGGFVELRDRLERVVLGGVSYEPDGSPARLIRPAAVLRAASPTTDPRDHPGGSSTGPVGPADIARGPDGEIQAAPDSAARTYPGEPGGPDSGQYHCEVCFGDVCYARVATLDADGTLIAGPHAIPACTSPVLDRSFPATLRDALAELVAEAVAAPLAADVRALCASSDLVWADLGARAAAERPGGFAVHAALWDRIAPRGLARLALALAEALAPVVAAAVVRRAAAAGSAPRYAPPSPEEPR